MIAFLAASALGATAPNGNTFELPPGWADGPAYVSGAERVTVVRVPGPCSSLASGVPWPVTDPWQGWATRDGAHHACLDVGAQSLVAHVAPSDAPFNRYLPLLVALRAAMEVEPISTEGTPSATTDDDAVPIVGGMGLFATLGEEAPAGGGLALHFSAPPASSGPFVGLDFGLGAVGGFLYETELRIGYGGPLGPIHPAVYSGVGVDGVTSRVRGSVEAPLGAIAFVTLVPRLTVELGGEGRWYTAGRRADDDGLIGFDELEAYGGLWFARRVPPEVEDAPMGLWLGGSWKDTADGWVARVTVGTGTVALQTR